VQIAYGIAGPVRTNAEEVGRVAGSRCARDAARLMPPVLRRGERDHARDLRHHHETRTRRAKRSPLRESERQEGDGQKRVDVVFAPRGKARSRRRRDDAARRKLVDIVRQRAERAIPGQERGHDADGSVRPIPVVAE
jgi:hypothetical protein